MPPDFTRSEASLRGHVPTCATQECRSGSPALSRLKAGHSCNRREFVMWVRHNTRQPNAS
jgi:hypothetical protein